MGPAPREALDKPRGSVSLGCPPATRDYDHCLPRLVGVRVGDPTLSRFPPQLLSSAPSVLNQRPRCGLTVKSTEAREVNL